jgi:hypothetical protein
MRPRRQVSADALLQVERELGIRAQVREPVAAPGRAAQVEPAVDPVEPGLDRALAAALAADRRDVDRAVPLESPANCIVHARDNARCGGAIPAASLGW